MNGRLGKDQIGNLTCRNTSVVDYCLSNVHFLERLVLSRSILFWKILDFSCSHFLTFSVEDSFGITSGSASSQWECSFLSVKVNGV
jgi:hypothetical protein